MLSRVADSLYWMSRYLERAEHTTRLLDVNLNLMTDESANSADRRWVRVLQALGAARETPWQGDAFALTHRLTFDSATHASVLGCIVAARENARHVREQISTEMWHRLNSLYLQVTRPEMQSDMHAEALLRTHEAPTEFLAQVMEAVHQFQGVTDSTMSHGEGWQFIQVGRYMERASASAMLLEAYQDELWRQHEQHRDGNEFLEWMGLLRSATAFEAYCKVYTADLTPAWILEFLLLDADFPHSLRFSIDAMAHALRAIEDISGGGSRSEKLSRLSGRLRATLSYSSVEEIMETGVVEYLHGIQRQCSEIHRAIYELYIDYSIQAALAG
ncbi:alpha-E domain-containing protein [Terriglobus aquaticus]|uniref:Alpha-E domain-containing protein n=1 Tax=Terriglobus aquaticus TaxID=940139 RepID=A0ABW9KM60_9BACT|nr:alpha-E domain-containing protein [Terriglobus aquaticus]